MLEAIRGLGIPIAIGLFASAGLGEAIRGSSGTLQYVLGLLVCVGLALTSDRRLKAFRRWRHRAKVRQSPISQSPITQWPTRTINSGGYVELTFESGRTVLEHRHIAEAALRRPIRANHVVHHINGNPADNRIENLCIMTRWDHNEWHADLRKLVRQQGFYPPINDQMVKLCCDYGAAILDWLPEHVFGRAVR